MLRVEYRRRSHVVTGGELVVVWVAGNGGLERPLGGRVRSQVRVQNAA